MNESVQTDPRKQLEALIGEWEVEAGPAGGPRWPGEARVTVAWLEEGVPLLVARTRPPPPMPASVAVMGCDGRSGAFWQLYTDDRDVQRLYQMSLADGEWKLWRDGEPFAQRFSARVTGDAIVGRWEAARHAGTWEPDIDIVYRRVGATDRGGAG